ncbi:MAG: UDP-N-acetylglucosamine 1-carboxyvinyltransferase [Deltaproteobacteria bacterium]|nr:UDP-N-acetylglucosamine 1-carboxyvinyltransferase [Deltaproteobacteria bacterium]
MSEFLVEGGRPITGTLVPSGNKNEALPVIAATVAAGGPVTLENVPRIGDVHRQLAILEQLGAKVEWRDEHTVVVDPAGVGDAEPDPVLCGQIRASFLLAGALLARRGHVRLPRPGGDRIGRRRVDTHLLALGMLGVEIEADGDYRLRAPQGLRAAEIFLDEASVMATENALVAAAGTRGETVIYNAASEPHVQGLCRMLQTLGAVIEGVGSNVLRIRGGPLHGGTHRIGPDHIEIGSFVGLAAVTGGALRIPGVRPGDLRKILMDFRRLGVRTEFDGDDLLVPGGQEPVVQADLGGAIPKLDDAPWPGFPADLTSIALVTATQSRGTVLIHEKLFESRLFFVDRLIAMGARVVLCDPHRAVVIGPSPLVGATLSSPDIRAGMALLIAALAAQGQSVIQNVEQIDRGYERIEERLTAVGARLIRTSCWDGVDRRSDAP